MKETNNKLPRDLYLAHQVGAMDHYAMEQCFIPGIALMENAGEAAWRLLQATWPAAKNIAVFCGPGNNGGDGYIVARLAKEAGLHVTVYSSGEPQRLKDDAAIACSRWLDAGGELANWPAKIHADIVVDGLLGTGLDRPTTGVIGDMIDAINTRELPVLALDIPSGLNADSGAILGRAVYANATISFMGLNQGLFTGDGPEVCGSVTFDTLGVPDEVVHSQIPSATLYRPERRILPPRRRNAHKGDYGHVLLIGGDSGFTGAIRLAGDACLRSGAGLASIASRTEHAHYLNASRPELMCHGVENRQSLKLLISKANVICIGPGLGQSNWASSMLAAVLESDLPLILDADALNLLAQDPARRDNWILTPHPGEAARLLGCSTSEIQQDRFKAVHELQFKYGGVILLKGAGTLVYDGEEVTVNITGNPGMASGGMGDVLSGVIAALTAQGLSLTKAASAGARLHGAAADEAADAGEIGLLASDLMPFLQKCINTR